MTSEADDTPVVGALRRAGAVLLGALLVVTPTLNPAISRAASARIYVSHLAVVALIATGFLVRLLAGQVRYVLIVTALVGAYVGLQVFVIDQGSVHARLAWSYRPLQAMLLAAAVAAVVRVGDGATWLVVAVGGAVAGIAFGLLGWLAPSLDLTELARPDIGWVSRIGDVPRAVAAFVYPNNFGTFGAYASLTGLWLVLSRDERVARWLGAAAYLAGAAALAASGNRSGGIGWVAATAVLVWRRRRSPSAVAPWSRWAFVVLGPVAAVGLTFAVMPLAEDPAPTASGQEAAPGQPDGSFVEDRLSFDVAGDSLSMRWRAWEAKLDDFREHPLVGAGVLNQRTDSLWLLYLGGTGLIGVGLLAAIAWRSWFALPGPAPPRAARDLRTVLLVVGGVSGILQDSLGQPLASWFPGLVIGIALGGFAPDPVAPEPATEPAPG